MEQRWRKPDGTLTRQAEDNMEVVTFRFGDFELDRGAYELRRNGRPVRIEQQPMDLLLLLVERRRQLVLRSDIVETLWGKDVFVDVDTGVHTAIRKIRRALRDSSDAPTFVETVPGKGYRFIADVEVVGAVDPQQSNSVSAEAASADASPPSIGEVSPPKVASTWPRLALAVLVVAVPLGIWIWSRQPAGAGSSSGPLTLAVLPFANLSADPIREYVAEGLAEDTATSLAQIDPGQMRVVAGSATARYKGSTKSASEIGRELAADFIIESSVRIEENRLRVTAKLVRVRDQVQVWSQSYDRAATTVLDLQHELSGAIAEQVRLRLSPASLEALTRRQTQNPEAYDQYLRGRNFENQRTPATNEQALAHYARATELDPEYALAWSATARVLAASLINGDASPTEVLPRARAAAGRAVATGPETSEAQFASAYLKWCCDWDWAGAETGFRRALALDPQSARGHLALGHALSQMGRHSEALPSTRRARTLDALSALMPALSSQVAYQARDYRGAVDHARQAIVLEPELWIGHIMLGQALEQLGEFEQALEALTTAARFSGNNSKAVAMRAYILAKTGRMDEAAAVRRTLQTVSKTKYVPPYALALISAGLGQRDAVFLWLEHAFDARDMHLIYLPVDPKWDSYRADPRFQSLIARCGFRM
jgi:TolB-like protein/DNA-binding winged helix-turn-helix (wHTH) protein